MKPVIASKWWTPGPLSGMTYRQDLTKPDEDPKGEFVWVQSRIGIVVTRSVDGKLRAYIQDIIPYKEGEDEQTILNWGARVHDVEALKSFFPSLKDDNWSED